MRDIRQKREFSRAGLAMKMKVHPLTIRRWETGKQKPNQHAVVVLAEILECEVTELTEGGVR
ncbi:multiprotein-bridging factor 1 family protein [Streptomyces goshikiensis]|uniref:multiprotein-bridging factor 1 family protein n=1 Tax=Streptomyces goshikiensis TaxID=1942 RepID=UPI0037A6930A